MRSASASNSPGVTATSCTQATTPNVPTPPKRQPLLGQIYSLTPFRARTERCAGESAVVGSAVIQLFQERFQARHIWFKVFLVVPPAADRRSIKWLFYLRLGRRVYALRARVLVKLQDVIFKPHAQKTQH